MASIYSLINVCDYTDTFNKFVAQHTNLLSFASKEDYLNWVSDWKQAYKDNVVLRRYDKINRRWNDSNFTSTSLETQLKSMEPSVKVILGDAVRMDRLSKWKADLVKNGYGGYGITSTYNAGYDSILLAHYLQLVRKAGKVKSNILRKTSQSVF